MVFKKLLVLRSWFLVAVGNVIAVFSRSRYCDHDFQSVLSLRSGFSVAV